MTLDAYLLWRFPPARPLRTEADVERFLAILKASDEVMRRVPTEYK